MDLDGTCRSVGEELGTRLQFGKYLAPPQPRKKTPKVAAAAAAAEEVAEEDAEEDGDGDKEPSLQLDGTSFNANQAYDDDRLLQYSYQIETRLAKLFQIEATAEFRKDLVRMPRFEFIEKYMPFIPRIQERSESQKDFYRKSIGQQFQKYHEIVNAVNGDIEDLQ